MGKSSNFKRSPRDLYRTWDPRAVLPLLKHLGKIQIRFAEPCAGAGDLIRNLQAGGHKCLWASDIEPLDGDIERVDVLLDKFTLPHGVDYIITNPPWTRVILHKMIEILVGHADVWLLLDSDWWHTDQADPYRHLIKQIVTVGRVKWFEKSEHDATDNCCWYLFSKKYPGQPTQIFKYPK